MVRWLVSTLHPRSDLGKDIEFETDYSKNWAMWLAFDTINMADPLDFAWLV